MRIPIAVLTLCFALTAQQPPSPQKTVAAMRKAAGFFADKVATRGGYHFYYAEDLSYGRSEHGEGPTQIEVQREATPRVGMAYLEAYEATRDPLFLEAARQAARALLAGQLCSGGWDYLIEFDPAKRKSYPYRTEHDCAGSTLPRRPPTSLDDNITQGATRLLMRVDRALDFKDAAIHEAARFVLDSLLQAQYENGAWPQRYTGPSGRGQHPDRRAAFPKNWPRQWPGENFQAHFTFNDNSILDAIDTMLEAARIYGERRYRESAERGGGFILLAQMPDPQPAWAQQYDAAMHPAWARVFEPPSVTGGESQGILRMLLTLYRETAEKKYLDAVPRALDYLERSVLPRPERLSEAWSRFRPDEPVLARFYELETNRPLFITKGTRVRAQGLGSKLIDGYQVSYSDQSVINHYSVLISGRGLKAIRADYERLRAAGLGAIRRPDRLRGLSPWQESSGQDESKPSASKVRSILDSMDSRGAWTEPGTIGKADQLVSVFAARPMVLTINGRAIQIDENDTIELFQGPQPPRTRIIRSSTFAENLETLAEFVK
jgi:PelA/Pel-15E family pectate lyase